MMMEAQLESEISIHAPRGGSDLEGKVAKIEGYLISIHAPRGGSDAGSGLAAWLQSVFQSTLPVGGATSLYVL